MEKRWVESLYFVSEFRVKPTGHDGLNLDDLAIGLADQTVMLNGGRVVMPRTAPEVLTVELIRAVFGVGATFVPVAQPGIHLVFD